MQAASTLRDPRRLSCSRPIACSESLFHIPIRPGDEAVDDSFVKEWPPPIYIIGIEVPVPGRAQHALDTLEVTKPEAALRTVKVHEKAFRDAGLETAFARAIGAVVQPGVEFASTEVIRYKPEKAVHLANALASLPGFVFEAHSTDYQPAASLDALVRDGFAILKVGPWLTFALREALYGLDCIARVLDLGRPGTTSRPRWKP